MDITETLSPMTGPDLVHYAAHYANENSSGPPPVRLLSTLRSFEELIARHEPDHAARKRWVDNCEAEICSFLADLEDAEESAPSNHGTASKRTDLSTRERAIFVSRFLTYAPVGRHNSTEFRTMSHRREVALSLPGRDRVGYLRFSRNRSAAWAWEGFEAELSLYIKNRATSSIRATLSGLPDEVQRLLRASSAYEKDIEGLIAGIGGEGAGKIYVVREIEDEIIDQILTPGSPAGLVIGDAGTGKSSVLWSVAAKLRGKGIVPVVVSATWLLASDGDLAYTTLDKVVNQLNAIKRTHLIPALLLDTADLLLHSEKLILQTNELFYQAEAHGIPVIATVRPIEASQITYLAKRVTLAGYTIEEMHCAVLALMTQYFPSADPTQGIRLCEEARTRSLPMLEIFESPLMLRLLFELSSGTHLPGTELDVTGLYEMYWDRRIVRDQRSSSYSQADDLSATAAKVAIAMLAESRPELDQRTIAALLPSVRYPRDAGDISSNVDALVSRGVLARSAKGIRYAHQTLFEFVAAKALLERAGARSAKWLLKHMQRHPYDLFTGAVFEQVLILLSPLESASKPMRAVITALLDSEEPTLRAIGALAWAHIPALEISEAELVRGLDESTVGRIVGRIPQVQTQDPYRAVRLIASLWKQHRQSLYRNIVACLSRLAGSWPASIASLCKELDLVTVLSEERPSSLKRHEDLFHLLFAIVGCDAPYVRQSTLLLLEYLPDVDGCLALLERTALVWPALNAPDYLEELTKAAVSALTRFGESRRRDFSYALGAVIFQQQSAEFLVDAGGYHTAWLAYAETRLARSVESLPPLREAAELHAIALYARSCGSQDLSHLEKIFDLCFSHVPQNGPVYIVGPFLAAILAVESPARRVVSAHLHNLLRIGLPATDNAPGSAKQLWARTARSALIDPGTPPTVVADVTTGLPGGRELWLKPDYLLTALVPAAVGNNRDALRALQSTTDSPQSLPRHSREIFVERAIQHCPDHLLAATAAVRVAELDAQTSIFVRACSSSNGRTALQNRRDRINAILLGLLSASDSEQRQGAEALAKLQSAGILTPSVSELAGALKSATDPKAKATLTGMLPAAVEQDLDQGPAVLAVIREEVLNRLQLGSGEKVLSAPHANLVNTAYGAYRGILSIAATAEGWEPLLKLVCQPPVNNGLRIEPGNFYDAARFLRNMRDREDAGIREIQPRFIEVAMLIAASNFSTKQEKKACIPLGRIARMIGRETDLNDSAGIFEALASIPLPLARDIISVVIGRNERDIVERHLKLGHLPGGLGEYAAERLRGHREHGYQPIPELLYKP